MTTETVTPFDPTASRMARIEAQGHLARTGHPLTGFYREAEPGIFRLIRTCPCNVHRSS